MESDKRVNFKSLDDFELFTYRDIQKNMKELSLDLQMMMQQIFSFLIKIS